MFSQIIATIHVLGLRAADRIGEVVRMITKIAAQTHLLALISTAIPF